jgi:hypothetical protein
MNANVSVLRLIYSYGAFSPFKKFLLCLALIFMSSFVFAQPTIVERCVPGGGKTTEQCNCSRKAGVTRQCEQLVSDQTGRRVGRDGKTCPNVCEGCLCPSAQGESSSSDSLFSSGPSISNKSEIAKLLQK